MEQWTRDPQNLSVADLIDRYGKELSLEILAGKKGLDRKIPIPETQRPGLALSGYLKGQADHRLLVMGKAEIGFLREIDSVTRKKRLEGILSKNVPAVIITRSYAAPEELIELCEKLHIPLMSTEQQTMAMLNKLTVILSEEFTEKISCHGTLVEAFGIGVLIQGDSSIGKSEAALGLIERGHRLISDDVVKIRKRESGYLEGTGPELTRHLIEIRGIGIINVAHLFGAVCISESRRIDMIIRLEEWDDSHFYDRVGLEDNYTELLGMNVPSYVLPVKPGRDVVLLIETTVLNHRLKEMGYNSAKEFNVKLLKEISERQRKLEFSSKTDS